MIEMIQMWAALESMAARLATLYATDAEIASCGTCSMSFRTRRLPSIWTSIPMPISHSIRRSSPWAVRKPSSTHTQSSHSRACIRRATIVQSEPRRRSIVDHLKIIEALEQRDTELAERLTRQHTLDLAAHVDRNCDFLD